MISIGIANRNIDAILYFVGFLPFFITIIWLVLNVLIDFQRT